MICRMTEMLKGDRIECQPAQSADYPPEADSE